MITDYESKELKKLIESKGIDNPKLIYHIMEFFKNKIMIEDIYSDNDLKYFLPELGYFHESQLKDYVLNEDIPIDFVFDDEDIIQFASISFEPRDIYSKAELEDWALDNGFVRKEE